MTLETAIRLAATAHEGQIYRALSPGLEDEPYIMHSLRVMGRVLPHARKVAVLHDVIEDGRLFGDRLRREVERDHKWWIIDGRNTEGLTIDERKALLLLTRDKEQQTYNQYIEALAVAEGRAGSLARHVKFADLHENLSRNPPERLSIRYRDALIRLYAAHGEDALVLEF